MEGTDLDPVSVFIDFFISGFLILDLLPYSNSLSWRKQLCWCILHHFKKNIHLKWRIFLSLYADQSVGPPWQFSSLGEHRSTPFGSRLAKASLNLPVSECGSISDRAILSHPKKKSTMLTPRLGSNWLDAHTSRNAPRTSPETTPQRYPGFVNVIPRLYTSPKTLTNFIELIRTSRK